MSEKCPSQFLRLQSLLSVKTPKFSSVLYDREKQQIPRFEWRRAIFVWKWQNQSSPCNNNISSNCASDQRMKNQLLHIQNVPYNISQGLLCTQWLCSSLLKVTSCGCLITYNLGLSIWAKFSILHTHLLQQRLVMLCTWDYSTDMTV